MRDDKRLILLLLIDLKRVERSLCCRSVTEIKARFEGSDIYWDLTAGPRRSL